MYRLVMLPILVSLGACGVLFEQELDNCLEWKTVQVVRKERLPAPMQGVVERVENHLVCIAREEEDDTLALRRPAI
jgi:hypothetical protein